MRKWRRKVESAERVYKVERESKEKKEERKYRKKIEKRYNKKIDRESKKIKRTDKVEIETIKQKVVRESGAWN